MRSLCFKLFGISALVGMLSCETQKYEIPNSEGEILKELFKIPNKKWDNYVGVKKIEEYVDEYGHPEILIFDKEGRMIIDSLFHDDLIIVWNFSFDGNLIKSIERWDVNDDSKTFHDGEYFGYDKFGRIISTSYVWMLDSDTIQYDYSFKYYKNHGIKYMTNDSYSDTMLLKYDESGDFITSIGMDTKYFTKSRLKIDDRGNVLLECFTSNEGSRYEERVYDDFDNIVLSKVYFERRIDIPDSIGVMKYRKERFNTWYNVNITDDTLQKSYDYQYDRRNNWILKMEGSDTLANRKIEYYE